MKLISEKELSKELGIKITTLQSNRYHNIGLPYYRIGRSVMYDLEEVKKYLGKCKVWPKSRKRSFRKDWKV